MKLQHKPPLQAFVYLPILILPKCQRKKKPRFQSYFTLIFLYLMHFTSIVIPAIITNITLRNDAKHHVPIYCVSTPNNIGVSIILRYENVICIPMTDCEDSSPNNCGVRYVMSLEYIGFEILCRMTLYNFSTIITMEVPIKKKKGKWEYQVNLSMAIKICFAFLLDHTGSGNVNGLISRYILPISPERTYARQLRFQVPASFAYRFV